MSWGPSGAHFRIHPNSVVSGRIDVAVTNISLWDGGLDQNVIGPLTGDGAYTAHIVNTGGNLIFCMEDSVGSSLGSHTIPIPGFLNSSNTRLLFGTGGTKPAFDNMVVEGTASACGAASPPPPALKEMKAEAKLALEGLIGSNKHSQKSWIRP